METKYLKSYLEIVSYILNTSVKEYEGDEDPVDVSDPGQIYGFKVGFDCEGVNTFIPKVNSLVMTLFSPDDEYKLSWFNGMDGDKYILESCLTHNIKKFSKNNIALEEMRNMTRGTFPTWEYTDEEFKKNQFIWSVFNSWNTNKDLRYVCSTFNGRDVYISIKSKSKNEIKEIKITAYSDLNDEVLKTIFDINL